MKKIIFALLAVALFASCGEKAAKKEETTTLQKYTIVGIDEAQEDGTQVFLYEDRRGKTVLETTTIQSGKFSFSGEIEEPVVRFIGIDGVGQLVVLEAGDIKFSDDGIPTGTPLNDKIFYFVKDANEKGSPETELFFNFSKENADNVLGQYFYERNSYAFEIDQLKEIMALIPEKAKESSEEVKTVKKYIEQLEATAIGVKFIDIKALTPEGKEIALSDYAGKGKVVLIDFWASWCPPCRADMPYVVAAYKKYKNKGFEIVGVSLDETNEDWVKGIKDLGITWPQMSDLKYWDSELSKTYGVRSIPATFLIDGEGNIIDKKIKGKDLDAKLSEIFK